MTNTNNLHLDEVQTNLLTQSLEGSLPISQVISSGKNKHNNCHSQLITLFIYILCIDEGFCNPDTTETRYGTYVWPETEVGQVVQMSCVFGSVTDQASVSRECVGIDQWMIGINPGLCFSEVTIQIQFIGVSL